MRGQSYLVRRGARYHFRRRLVCDYKCSRAITVALGTADPVEARRLVRRLAGKWDDLTMQMIPRVERGTLTVEEAERIYREAMVDEIARATAHVTAPLGRDRPHPLHHKVYAAAYRIVGRVPHYEQEVAPAIVEAEIDETWTAEERELLENCLRLAVTPMSVSRTQAKETLADFEGPFLEGAIREARSHILRGYAAAHDRAAFLEHPAIVASAKGVLGLLDDSIFSTIAGSNSGAVKENPVSEPPQGAAQTDGLFAMPGKQKFSEIIKETLSDLEEERGWKPDRGQRRGICDKFAWMTGNKPLEDYSPLDVQNYARWLKRVPSKYPWAKMMQKPFDESTLAESAKDNDRSKKTINRDLSVMHAVSERLAESYWRPKYAPGVLLDFSKYTSKVEDDPLNPDRMPWTPERLKTMYSMPLWQGSGGKVARLKAIGPRMVYQDAAFWAPIIGTYTGASREEVCGIEIGDINFDCEVPYVIIRQNGLRGLKALARGRVVPFHSELLRLGLRDYVEAIAAESHPGMQAIFPELYDRAAKINKKQRIPRREKNMQSFGGHRFYSIAWCYIADATHAIMPLPETSIGKKTDFHSQRTYNQSILAAPDIAQTIIDRHMGHKQKGTGPGKYNRRALAIGEANELAERRTIIEKEMPVVTDHIDRPATVNLLPLAQRSRVGSAPGRDARRKFCS